MTWHIHTKHTTEIELKTCKQRFLLNEKTERKTQKNYFWVCDVNFLTETQYHRLSECLVHLLAALVLRIILCSITSVRILRSNLIAFFSHFCIVVFFIAVVSVLLLLFHHTSLYAFWLCRCSFGGFWSFCAIKVHGDANVKILQCTH